MVNFGHIILYYIFMKFYITKYYILLYITNFVYYVRLFAAILYRHSVNVIVNNEYHF